MPVVCAYFVGRITHLGQSLRSWVKERRARPFKPIEGPSSASLAPNGVATSTPPRLSESTPAATLTGVRKFIRNFYRSDTDSSAGDQMTVALYSDLASTDLDYHDQLRRILSDSQTSHSKVSRPQTGHGEANLGSEQV